MIDRRSFVIQTTLASSAALYSADPCSADPFDEPQVLNGATASTTTGRIQRIEGNRVKLGLNAFTFNHELLSGQMTMEDVIDFCAENNVDGVDMTAYYFPGYPAVCDDSTLFRLKRYAFVNGVTISGTGVRNSFTTHNNEELATSVRHTKEWIEAAAKLGSDVLRVFSGSRQEPGPRREESQKRLIESLKDCSEHAEQYGVILSLQHHHDFLKTAEQTRQVIEAVDSPWCGVVLDIGSLRDRDVYAEIERLLPYATTWQMKEQVWVDGEQVPTDLDRVSDIIHRVGYRGFLPIEILGKGKDINTRKENASKFLEQVRNRMIAV